MARAHGPGAVHRERAHGQEVALAREHHRGHALHEVRRGRGNDGRPRCGAHTAAGGVHGVQVRQGGVDGGEVLLDDLGAALGVALLDRVLDARDGLVRGEDAGDREEAGLHDGVDAAAHPRFAGHAHGVDGVDLQALGEDRLLHLARQVVPQLVRRVGRVEEEHRARGRALQHVVVLEQLELVAGHEAGAADEVGRAQRARAEAQVRDGHRARLLGVVDEVALGEVRRLLGDDLDRVLVGADGTVGTEHRAHDVGRFDVERRLHRQRQVGDVVVDPDGEVRHGPRPGQLVEDGLHHRGVEFLRGQAVAARDDRRLPFESGESRDERLAQRGQHIEVQRIPHCSRLLRPVHHRDREDGGRQRGHEVQDRERAVEPDPEQADLLATVEQPVHRLVRRLRA